MDSFLAHYGTPRHSGRYPYGSGENPFQHDSSFLNNYDKYKESGMSETEIAEAMGMSTTELRKRKSLEKADLKKAEYAEVIRLKDKGWSNVAIGERIGRNESYVRTLLDPVMEERSRKLEVTASILKDSVDSNKYIDIGPGSEQMLGVSRTKLMTAVQKLEDEGYKKQYLKIEQAGIPGQYTDIQVLTKEDVSYKELRENRDKIAFPMEGMNVAELRSNKGDASISNLGLRKPVSIDSKRIDICYAEDGGKDKDGVIELRRGVDDISLGDSRYAQVRIAVDGTHYLKGMAVYADDLPDGVDIRFNTNKTKDVPKMDVLKPLKTNKDGSINWDNPFGATLEMEDGRIVGQRDYIDKDGNPQQSCINIVRSEGSWNTWSNTLASQFLSKQPTALIKQQLNKSYAEKKDQLIDISKLTNPEVKKLMLDQFANDCDASSAHLKAAALPRQSSKVILPLIDISENEIYAPGYENGEEVILVRYPHGGTFEIPTLTVNNKIGSGKRIIGPQAVDAVGINSKVAERLSGADFDGDTVVVIPTKGQKLKTTSPLAGLKDFDPKEMYGPKSYAGKDIKLMTENQKQTEMGKISNLITDMTLKGATSSELARAVRHSMVVIDAPKHKLDYKQSYEDNNIRELKIIYQGGPNSGASTLISQAKADTRIPVQKEKYGRVRTDEEEKWFNSINPNSIDILSKEDQKKYKTLRGKLSPDEADDYASGKKVYYQTGETYKKINKQGEAIDILRTEKVPRMTTVENAYELSSGTTQENLYADYANKLKALANDARKEYRATPSSKYSPSARETYAKEVASLNEKLKVAQSNKPLERRAQLIADVTISSKMQDNPEIKNDKDELKKLRTQALAAARARTGASKTERSIDISDKEWEAIQAGAISANRLSEILENTNMDKVKQLATPRDSKELTPAQISKINSLANSGHSLSEISKSLGISSSTASKYIK